MMLSWVWNFPHLPPTPLNFPCLLWYEEETRLKKQWRKMHNIYFIIYLKSIRKWKQELKIKVEHLNKNEGTFVLANSRVNLYLSFCLRFFHQWLFGFSVAHFLVLFISSYKSDICELFMLESIRLGFLFPFCSPFSALNHKYLFILCSENEFLFIEVKPILKRS